MLAMWGLDSLTEASCSTFETKSLDQRQQNIFCHLACERATKVHGATPGLVGLQPEHAGAGQLVVRRPARALLLDLHHVDRVPATLDLLRISVTSLLDENDSCRQQMTVLCRYVQIYLAYKYIHPAIYSAYLQNHGLGPTDKQKTRRPQSTSLCTGQTQCWHQSPASSVSRLASRRHLGRARTGCSRATWTKRVNRIV